MTQETNSDLNPASQRHWMYGFNAGMLVVIGAVILIFLMVIFEWTKDRPWTHADWSTNAANSLSDSSVKLLREVGNKHQDYTILSLFAGPNDEERKRGDPLKKAEQRRQVNDLLHSYARACGYIKVEDQADVAREDVEQRVRMKYEAELKPYQKAVDDHAAFATKLSDFFKEEQAAIAAFAQRPGATKEELEAAGEVQAQFRSLVNSLNSDREAVREAVDTTLPQWNAIVDQLRKSMNSALVPMFGMLSDPAKLKEAKDPLLAYFTANNAKYKAMADLVNAYQDQLTKLPPLKVDEVLNGIQGNCLVILGADSAKVLGKWDLYESPQDADRSVDAPQPLFKGEEAISSALLAIAKPEKVKVVFVSPSPGGIARDYSDTKSHLEASNFECLDWSPPNPQAGGPPDSAPPAEGKGVVWIVFPPDMPRDPQMMMMGPPNPGPVIDATKRHLAKGGNVLFFAEKSSSPFGAVPGSYAYTELVSDFGIDVKSKYSVVNQVEGEDPDTGQHVTMLQNAWVIEHFPENDITKPAESLPTLFGPSEQVTVVDVSEKPPAGVDATVIIKTPGSSDFWAEANFSRTATFEKDSDLRSPISIAVASIKNKGKKDAAGESEEQRVLVIGSSYVGSNTILRIRSRQGILMGSGQIYRPPLYPGNDELMHSSVLWVAGYENMIAVSARANLARRIDVSQTGLRIVRGTVIAGIPLLALLLGGLMWMIRRR